MPALELDCDGFEVETLMNVRALKAGLKVAEVASFETERIHGHSNLRAVPDGWRVLKTIVHERLRRTPAAANGCGGRMSAGPKYIHEKPLAELAPINGSLRRGTRDGGHGRTPGS